MAHNLLLLGFILAPVIVLTLFRIDAAMVFLSLCLGDVMVQYIGNDATDFISGLSPRTASVSNGTLSLVLLFIPVVLTMFLMLRSVKGNRLILNMLPALCVGLVGVLIIIPLLPSGLRSSIFASSLWQQYTKAETLIVSASALISIGTLWVQRRFPAHSSSGKHSRSKS